MKCCDEIGVPTNDPKLPVYCQPLLESHPCGAQVLRQGVRARITARAGAAQIKAETRTTSARTKRRMQYISISLIHENYWCCQPSLEPLPCPVTGSLTSKRAG